MMRVTITQPVKVGGKRRMPGATLDVDEDTAEELEDLGVATIDGDAPEPTSQAPIDPPASPEPPPTTAQPAPRARKVPKPKPDKPNQ